WPDPKSFDFCAGRPHSNAGGVQPLKSAAGSQPHISIRGDTPVQVAVVVGLEVADGMRPAHHLTGTLEVHVLVTEDGAIGALFPANKLPARINLLQKGQSRGKNQ